MFSGYIKLYIRRRKTMEVQRGSSSYGGKGSTEFVVKGVHKEVPQEFMDELKAICKFIAGVYIGVEQLVNHARVKMDFVNGAVGGFLEGAAVLGFKVL